MAKKNLSESDYRCTVKDYPERMECPICLLLMQDPHIVSCCGKKFCESCIGKVSQTSCPVCKQNFTSMLEKELKRQIMDLKTCCTQEECAWVGEVRDFEDHITKYCEYGEVDCNLKCGLRMQRKQLPFHQLHICSERSKEVQMASITYKLEERVAALEKLCASQSQKIDDLKTELSCVCANTILPRFFLLTTAYNDFLYYSSFYSHRCGYNLRLESCTKQSGFMSFNMTCQLQSLKGVYDDGLEWPVDIEASAVVTSQHLLNPEPLSLTFILKNVVPSKKEGNPVNAKSQVEVITTKHRSTRCYIGEIRFVSVVINSSSGTRIVTANT